VTRARLIPAAVVLAAAAVAADPTVDVADAWISEPPPGAGVAAAYMEIRNATQAPMSLTGATAPRFDRVEMHETSLREGMASMRRLEQVDIPAGGTVSFATGGKHFMLFGKPPLPRAGENVSLKLNFADGSMLDLNVPVRGIRPQ
jgi:copper(I)-binding protein